MLYLKQFRAYAVPRKGLRVVSVNMSDTLGFNLRCKGRVAERHVSMLSTPAALCMIQPSASCLASSVFGHSTERLLSAETFLLSLKKLTRFALIERTALPAY